jgi:ribonuclease J
MKLKIIKGTNEIGGNCVELKTKNTTILIDYGKPLDYNDRQIEITEKINAVLISHPHMDHFGAIEKLSNDIPIYCSKLSLELMNAPKIFVENKILDNNFKHFEKNKTFKIGDFKIIPYLVDHSSSDSFTFLIEADNKKVLYSGDFRNHGRRGKLFDILVKNKDIKNVDVLLMEGTMLKRSNDKFPTEKSVENKISQIIEKNNQISFIICSSQNIDTITSAYRACKRNKKIFVVDFYTAWILEKLKLVSDNVPNMSWNDVKILKKYGGWYYEKIMEHKEYFGKFRHEVFNNIVEIKKIKENPSKYFFKIGVGHIQKLLEDNNIDKANIIYSQWLGYLEEEYEKKEKIKIYRDLKEKYYWYYAHTSGHADLSTLKKFAKALKPKILIPIHTEYKDEFKRHFDNVLVLDDGNSLDLNRK